MPGQTVKADPGPILVVDVKGAIGVGTGYFLTKALERARDQRAGLLVVRIDTPGGLVSATRDIIQAILASPVPVAVFVAPSGARAASAGTYIAYAAHIAAMAPGTHLGAATPVQLGAPGLPGAPEPPNKDDGGKDDASGGTAMERKVMNDAIAYIRSLAQLRGRNADWAEQAVREAATLTAAEALKENVVDVTAANLADLLEQLDGRPVETADGTKRLDTFAASVVTIEPDWQARLLSTITDPNIAFILLMIGIYGIIFEFWSPGLTGPGVVGAISLILGLMALSALPVNYAGLALLALGVALMAAEAFAPGFGILGIGGVVAFAFGAMFLFEPSGSDIELAVAWPIVAAAAVTSALLLIWLLGMVVRERRRNVVTGAEQMIGLDGVVVEWSGETGHIRVRSELWKARADTPQVAGHKVRVVSRDGLLLVVADADRPTEHRS